ncbi:MAG: chloride channel protein, partial [Chloroflexi bacterium]|nr:chloride channel protein [Chloroflexota bacterium]
TFNAPIGGVFFAVEVILADFAVHSFSMVVLSSVVAAVISRATIGDRPAFGVPPYTLGQAWELLLAAALGLLAALVAVGFMRALVGCEALFERWRAPAALKPAVGGLCVGALGLAYAELLGPGFSTIQRVLDGHVTLGASLALVFLKPVATALTLGSGGSGGVFAPSLFIGAVLGSAVGGFAQQVLHLATSPGPAYALLGMAALFAATTRAPVTAIVIIFELTNDYRIILPLMVATAVSVVAAQRLHPESVATMVLARRGIRLPSGLTQNPMDAVRVEEAMTRDFSTVPPDLPLSELATRFSRTGYHGFPVVDRQGRLAGIVTLSDLENAVLQGTPSTDATVRVADIMTTDLIAAYPDETLHQVLSRAGAAHVGRIPVIERGGPRRLVGVLRRTDIISAPARGCWRSSWGRPPSSPGGVCATCASRRTRSSSPSAATGRSSSRAATQSWRPATSSRPSRFRSMRPRCAAISPATC